MKTVVAELGAQGRGHGRPDATSEVPAEREHRSGENKQKKSREVKKQTERKQVHDEKLHYPHDWHWKKIIGLKE